ncbi:MAG: hypothetical protein P0Y48_07835 [Candidatus Microbacterium phytovorans]|uniref:DNA mimic protein DMP19 C-terminal domain-containing protein n=1 Tax=Candidatus Microbacterium phytovorans TaxID=3121374 RepID=A0AAJ5W0W8_9MICO|nr:hypothetical protein [Microbacterium sp.]WEK12390.1 MAG: hypothetical protein P0Y48_07835 [Microbacterium sp.]
MSAHTDAIWERALDLASPTDATHPGDAALLTVLTFHGLVHNGGLLNAVELHAHDEVYTSDAVVDAYRFLGLEDAAAAIDNAVLEERDLVTGDDDDDDDDDFSDAAERIDATYTLTDEDIDAALQVAFANDPEAFAPLD